MDNCLTWVARRYRFWRKDHHTDMRRSHWGMFPHFALLIELENGNLVKQEYVPVSPRKRLLPPLFFKGKVVTTLYIKVDQTTVLPGDICRDETTNQ